MECHFISFHFIFYFSLFGFTCTIWKLPDQGSNSSHIGDLCHSFGNARSNLLCPARNQTGNTTEMSQIINPLCLSGNSGNALLMYALHYMYVYVFKSFITTVFLFFFFFCLFRAAPTAYGGCQARGQIGAVPASLHHSHSNARSERLLQTTPQLMAVPDP